jgi:hypothetical protein
VHDSVAAEKRAPESLDRVAQRLEREQKQTRLSPAQIDRLIEQRAAGAGERHRDPESATGG